MRLITRSILFIVAALFLSACTLALDPNLMQGELAPTPTPEPLALTTAADVPRISVEEAKAHFDNGTALFVDSRSAGEYDRAHIAGAAPGYALTTEMLEKAQQAEQLIITYCT